MDGEQSDSIESDSFRRRVSQGLMASVRPSTKDRQAPRSLLALTAEARVVKTGQRNGHTPSITFRHLPPNSARFGYATEGALFISAQLSTDAVSALRKVRVLI